MVKALVAEYSTIVTLPTQAKISYLTSDHLGSPRIITDTNGDVISRHDYTPFGEEVGINSDTVRKQFTGYERDRESHLDFAQARMYSYSYGRFTSADPLLESAEPNNPQSWNRYVYTYNNPLNLVDPTGLVVDDYFINKDGSQTIVKTDCECDTFYIETEKDSGEYYKLATLQRNKLGLVNFPARMSFFDRYAATEDRGGGDHGAGDHYVKPEVAAALFGLAAVLKDNHQITISYGDMSSSNGRDPWQPGSKHHSGHGHDKRSGLDADFRYINKDGKSFQEENARSDPQFSVEKNQIVFDTGKKFGFTENYQGISQGKNTGLTGVDTARSHNDHGHLGFSGNGRVTYARGITVLGGRGTYKPF